MYLLMCALVSQSSYSHCSPVYTNTILLLCNRSFFIVHCKRLVRMDSVRSGLRDERPPTLNSTSRSVLSQIQLFVTVVPELQGLTWNVKKPNVSHANTASCNHAPLERGGFKIWTVSTKWSRYMSLFLFPSVIDLEDGTQEWHSLLQLQTSVRFEMNG